MFVWLDNWELQKVLKHFQKLKCVYNENGIKEIQWRLEFSANFIEKLRGYEVFNFSETKSEVRGGFDIMIDISSDNPYRKVFEVWWEIQRIAEKERQNLIDLHSKTLGWKTNVCLTWYLQENYEATFEEFLFEYVVPFFADILYFEKYKYWPRGEYKHGIPWLFESFYDFVLDWSSNKEQWTKKLLEDLQRMGGKSFVDLIFVKNIKWHYITGSWVKLRNIFESQKAYKWFCFAREVVREFNIKP